MDSLGYFGKWFDRHKEVHSYYREYVGVVTTVWAFIGGTK